MKYSGEQMNRKKRINLCFLIAANLLLLLPTAVEPMYRMIFGDDILLGGHAARGKPLLLLMIVTGVFTMVVSYLKSTYLRRQETGWDLSLSEQVFDGCCLCIFLTLMLLIYVPMALIAVLLLVVSAGLSKILKNFFWGLPKILFSNLLLLISSIQIMDQNAAFGIGSYLALQAYADAVYDPFCRLFGAREETRRVEESPPQSGESPSRAFGGKLRSAENSKIQIKNVPEIIQTELSVQNQIAILVFGFLAAVIQVLPAFLAEQIFDVMIPEQLTGQIVQMVWILIVFSVARLGFIRFIELTLERSERIRNMLQTELVLSFLNLIFSFVNVVFLFSINKKVTVFTLMLTGVFIGIFILLGRNGQYHMREALLSGYSFLSTAFVFGLILLEAEFRTGQFVAYLSAYLIFLDIILDFLQNISFIWKEKNRT